jgi:hypothetical protein
VILSVLYSDTYANFFEIDFLLGAISLIVGSFVSTFISKDKKIQYGIYSGIIFIIYRLLANVFHMNILHGNYYIIIISTIGYLFLTIMGSYLATKTRRLKSEI